MQINSTESLTAVLKLEVSGDASIAEIRKFATPPISALVKDRDRTEPHKLIMAFVLMINQYYGVTWSDYQLTEFAKEFYAKYYYWHQLDLVKFMSMCRNREFEKLLSVNQFSPFILMTWAATYDNEWISVSEQNSYLAHDAHKHDSQREHEFWTDEMRQIINRRTAQEKINNLSGTVQRQRDLISKLMEERNSDAL